VYKNPGGTAPLPPTSDAMYPRPILNILNPLHNDNIPLHFLRQFEPFIAIKN